MISQSMILGDFMSCWFNSDFSKYTKEQFETAYLEYVDTSGLSITRELELLCHIHYINNRIFCIKASIKLQRSYLDAFGEPCIQEFKFINKYGYKLYWSGSAEKFLEAISMIESREKKQETELEIKIKELHEFKKKKELGIKSALQSRHDFIKTVNDMQRTGYHIDKSSTTLEEFSLMLLQLKEERTKK